MQSNAVLSSHDRILQAAKQLFALRGYENTTTIMIARAATTSESQLVKHFGSKDGLLEAIFEEGWKAMAGAFAAASDAEQPIVALRLLLRSVLDGLEGDIELKELFLFEARRIRREGNVVLISRSFRDFIDRVENLLSALQRQGSLRPGLSPQAAASALIGICEGMLRDQLLARRQGTEVNYTVQDIYAVADLMLSVFAVPEKAGHAVNRS